MKLSIERRLTVVKWKGYSHQANWLAATTILPALKKSFSSKKVKNILHSAKKQLPNPAKNADKTLGIIFN